MSSKSDLVVLFRKLLKLEEDARDLYAGYLKAVSDPDLVKDLAFIHGQEIQHVELAKQALAMLGETV